MSRAKTSTRKSVSDLPASGEVRPLTERHQQVFGLISSGYLPPADSITKDGEPTWSFENLALIVGCDTDELIKLLKKQHPRFTIETGSRH